MFKNVASQKIALFAFTTATGVARTGDAANLTAYVSKDFGAVTVLGDTSATEMDATNAPGWYVFDLAQGETNADSLLFTAKSSTSGVAVVGRPVNTVPNRFTTMAIDADGATAPTALQNADAMLNRDMGAVSDTNSRSPLNALRFIRNGFSISGATLTVLKEDDTTAAYTRDLTTDAAADPITGVS